jgi:DNA-binding NtrC family response regulator
MQAIKLGPAPDLCGLRYASRAMHELVATALRVARSDAPVLVTGPSGAGKEMLAEILHRNSRRAHRPFVRVNAGAIPESLFEAELFGVESGAYTGATRQRPGLLARAHGGTLFLDEIGNLPTTAQAKLLRVLQGGDYQRLGGGETRFADVRLVSATNVDLAAAVDEGTFREDLFYRLDVVQLRVPPLADRKADIIPIATRFLESSPDDGPRTLSEAACTALVAHAWPGNVRELQNRLVRARLLADGSCIEPRDLGLDAPLPARRLAPAPLRAHVRAAAPTLDRSTLESVLQKARGNVTRAALRLGVSRQALYRAMDRLGIAGVRGGRAGAAP